MPMPVATTVSPAPTSATDRRGTGRDENLSFADRLLLAGIRASRLDGLAARALRRALRLLSLVLAQRLSELRTSADPLLTAQGTIEERGVLVRLLQEATELLGSVGQDPRPSPAPLYPRPAFPDPQAQAAPRPLAGRDSPPVPRLLGDHRELGARARRPPRARHDRQHGQADASREAVL